ncbi:unnamed protein product [Parajaminaea phylloscopi]
MDFTPLYPVQGTSAHHVQFSPGSTFVVSLADQSIIVRAAHDLALVRCWTISDEQVEDAGPSTSSSSSLPSSLPAPVDRVAWSSDGAYILAISTKSSTIRVFVLDSRREPEHLSKIRYHASHSDVGQEGNLRASSALTSSGAIAQIALPASMDLAHAHWAPGNASSPAFATVFAFSSEDAGVLVAHCLTDSSMAVFRDVKLRRCVPHPRDRSVFALLLRNAHSGQEVVAIYRYDEDAARASRLDTRSAESAAAKAESYTALLKQVSSASSASPSQPSTRGPGLATFWRLDSSFHCRTNDAASLTWSPDGNFLAVTEGVLEYKLHLFTPMGFSRGTFAVSDADLEETELSAGNTKAARGEPAFMLPSEVSDATSAKSRTTGAPHDASGPHTIAGGGLGIRVISWQPEGNAVLGLLAVGGYDGKVHLLGPAVDGSGEWGSLGTPLDLARKTFNSPLADTRRQLKEPRLCAQVHREPKGWLELTGRRGIVPFVVDEDPDVHGGFPVSVPSLRPDWDKASPKSGIHWMEWDPSGQFLAIRNEAMPSTLFVYVLLARDADSQGIRGTAMALFSVVMFATSITAAAWRPHGEYTSTTDSSRTQEAQLAVLTASSSATYLWTCEPSSGKALVEGVPVPMHSSAGQDGSGAGEFVPSAVRWSPDGLKLLLACAAGAVGLSLQEPSSLGAYCVAVAISDEEGSGE